VHDGLGQDVGSTRWTREDKRAWRERLREARRAVPARVRAAETRRLTDAVSAAAAGAIGPVCGYLPTATEPGSVVLLDALRAAGHRVLLPVLPPDVGPASSPTPLRWAEYTGVDGLRRGPFGLWQPGGRPLGPATLAEAGLVLVPALAVDRHGVRMGQGGGWYDRSLPLAAPGAALVGVVRDEELVDLLPRERHDVRLTAVLTPGHGVRALPLPVA
jgi:5-formyltetrahydrofolate cyclo-ligase